jgi:hypothetical protein
MTNLTKLIFFNKVVISTISLLKFNNIARKILHDQLAEVYFSQFVLKFYTNNTCTTGVEPGAYYIYSFYNMLHKNTFFYSLMHVLWYGWMS